MAYRTLPELYEAYTDVTRKTVETRIGQLDWPGIIGPLCRHMSDNEVLNAPATVLRNASPSGVRALESEGILVRERGRIGFFHETYFDYLFAETFVADDEDLHDFLVESGQYLFRRAQARQVLEYLANVDRERFRTTVTKLLTSSQIRSHLYDVVVGVLRQLDASAEDWAAIESAAWSDVRAAGKVRALLSDPRWFDAADDGRRWEEWLADPATVDAAFQQLLSATGYDLSVQLSLCTHT